MGSLGCEILHCFHSFVITFISLSHTQKNSSNHHTAAPHTYTHKTLLTHFTLYSLFVGLESSLRETLFKAPSICQSCELFDKLIFFVALLLAKTHCVQRASHTRRARSFLRGTFICFLPAWCFLSIPISTISLPPFHLLVTYTSHRIHAEP